MGIAIGKLEKIKMLVLDVDGVLTDCRIWLDTDGEWKRFFSIRDGYGIRRIIEAGFKTAIITGSKSKDIQERAKSLGIHFFYEGKLHKSESFDDLLKQSGVHEKEVAYMGDDLFDIPLLKRAGLAATVPEALDEVKAVSDYVTSRPGGNGAVREICEFIIKYSKQAVKT